MTVIIIKMANLNGRGGVIIILLYFSMAHCSVFWYMSTKQAVFGQDIILTCNTGHPLLNSKDCPVRQWSGGPESKGLMYNGYPSNEKKYEEIANLSTNLFSLKIKNFSVSDVNVNYTCLCGFNTSIQELALNNTHFYYLPTSFNINVDTRNDSVKVKIECNKVFPQPTCFVNIGSRLAFKDVLPITQKEGLFYRLMFEKEFALSDDDCNMIPVVTCEFCTQCRGHRYIKHSGNKTKECTGIGKQIKLAEITTMISVDSKKKAITTDTIVALVMVLGSITVAVITSIICYALRKQRREARFEHSADNCAEVNLMSN